MRKLKQKINVITTEKIIKYM